MASRLPTPEEIKKRRYNAEKSRRWREKNYERYREVKDRSVEKHGDRVKRGKIKRHQTNPVKRLIAHARRRAQVVGMDFLLEEGDIEIPSHCPVLGIVIFVAGGKATDNSPTIDRINNQRGYLPDNVIVVSWRANRLKSDATLEEMKLLAKFYRRFV